MAHRGASLSLLDLTKHYGDVRAVEGVSLEIGGGEFVTLLGPSGSGKTTTLNMVAGFIRPTGGEVYLDGRRVTDAPPHRRGLGVVFQNYALFPHLSVFENMAFPLRVRRRSGAEIRRRVEETLELVGLDGYAERMPRQLSGGQQQRVALARALVFDPPALLMDEPLGALDKKLRQRLQVEIKQIQARLGFTAIYVTHDQEEALVMSDRIAVMNHGRIEQLGTPEELYARPANEFVADFVGESNLLSGTVVKSGPGLCTFQVAGEVEVSVWHDESWGVGTKGLLALRPEEIVVAEGPVEAGNCFQGEIEAVLFVGDSTKYAVRVAPGVCLSARVQHNPGQFRRGGRVVVHWPSTGGRLIRPSARSAE